ncbi:hypothetical protein [Streptomyces sp. NPDC005486]|uniref:hypothetical protein n=1 Tax=Streptomyces sp. NPDC005486 TaxID=3155345 RepID=UPI0033B1D9F1
MASAVEDSEASAGALSPSGCTGTVEEDIGPEAAALPSEQPARAKIARALRLRTVVA